MLDLNDMLYFVEVVERGGFAAAGRALGVPKSRLSRRVAELEDKLGVRLLQRTTRKLSLTAVGESFLRHGQVMRDAAMAAADAAAEVQTEPRGTIRVTCPVTLAQTVLGELLPQFLQRCPLVQVDMCVTNRAVDVVEEAVDVALRVRASLEDSGSMVVKRLGWSTTLLVASPDLLERQGTPQTLADLQHLDCMAMSAVDGQSSLLLLGPQGQQHRLLLQPRYVVDDLLTLKFAALAGSGMCWLPDYMCQDEIKQQRLVPLLPQWAPPPGIVHAVFSSRRGLVPAVRHFLDFLAETVPERHGMAAPAMGQGHASTDF